MNSLVAKSIGILSLSAAAYLNFPMNSLDVQTLDLNGLASLQNAKAYASVSNDASSPKNIGTLDMWKTDTMLDMWKTDTMLDMWKTDTMLDMWKTDTMLDMWKTDTMLNADSNLL